mgnify:CR=1 FL=1
MRAGEFEDGARTLRAKIDMASPNMKMRDPPLYRIRHATHHRTGDAWCIYPMYDYAHCLSDSIEGIAKKAYAQGIIPPKERRAEASATAAAPASFAETDGRTFAALSLIHI